MQPLAHDLSFMPLTTPRNTAFFQTCKCGFRRSRNSYVHARPFVFLSCTSLLLSSLPSSALAQQKSSRLAISASSLRPDAPLARSGPQGLFELPASSVKEDSSVSGTVLDPSGAAVSGAQVRLAHWDGTQVNAVISGENGDFTFRKLPAGHCLVTVNATGFGQAASAKFTLTEQQVNILPSIVLQIPRADTSVMVRPTEVIAAEQTKVEEKQRLLGVIPNFYTSYVPNPAPMTLKQKFSLAAHDTFDWTSSVEITSTAGIEQGTNAFPDMGEAQKGTPNVGERCSPMGVPVTFLVTRSFPRFSTKTRAISIRAPGQTSPVLFMP